MTTLYCPPCAYCGKHSHKSQDCPDLPAQAPAMPAWKQRDEEELRTVRATLAELEARRELAISKIKGVANMAFESGMTRDEYVAWLIVNADEIRDTLAPFDSGVREA